MLPLTGIGGVAHCCDHFCCHFVDAVNVSTPGLSLSTQGTPHPSTRMNSSLYNNVHVVEPFSSSDHYMVE